MITSGLVNVKGSMNYPKIYGTVVFEKYGNGVVVNANIHNLPVDEQHGFFAFHLHDGTECTDIDKNNPFPNSKGHYGQGQHPFHKGDFPPLLADKFGYAYLSFYTDRFELEEVIGKIIIIHLNRDDFTTQPSGDSGEKIACGILEQIIW